MRSQDDYRLNSVNKRGIVVDRDPKKMKVKVNFEDEDETVSMWIDVFSSSSGETKTFMMPDLDDEVWCALDAKGEDGCTLGSKYNEKDTPPHDSNDDVSFVHGNGSFHFNKATGNLAVNVKGDVTITASGNIILESAELTHNGKNVGHDHKHIHPPSGTPVTGEPEG